MGKFKDGLVAMAQKLTGSASGAGSAGDVMEELGNEASVSATGRALLAAADAAAARTAIGAGTSNLAAAAAQADSTATELAGLVADFNALLAKLRAAGHIAGS